MATTLPRNAQVAEQFDLLADLLELDGEEQFRVLAYRRAADQIRSAAGPIAEQALAGEAKSLPGIGKTIESKIVQIVESGEIEALTKRKERVPAGVAEFLRLPALGPKTARRIWQDLGITTMDDLRKAAEAEQLRSLPGLGAKTEERILKALEEDKKPREKRTLLARALPAVQAVVEVLREHPASNEVSEAGSVRRRTETVKDLDIIATASDPAALTEYFTKLTWVSEIKAHGKTKATVVSHDGLVFDLRVVPPDSYGNLLQHFTGSKRHNVELREDAVKRGLSVSEYGVKDTESFEEVDPIIAAFRRMVRGNEFDICEMAITTYICAKAHGKPMTAVPVFLVRAFHHGAILVNTQAGIRHAEGPRRQEGWRQPRLHRHDRRMGAQHPAGRTWRGL